MIKGNVGAERETDREKGTNIYYVPSMSLGTLYIIQITQKTIHYYPHLANQEIQHQK